MKQNVLKLSFAIFALFGFSYAAYAQDSNERLPRFTYEVGIGTSFLGGVQNFSPWGVHYRENFNSGIVFYAQVNYIFQSGRLLGFRVDGFGTAGNYTLTSGERVAENIVINYFAPQWGWVRFISPRVPMTTNVGIGYARYQSNGLLDDTTYCIRSSMLGTNVDFSLAYLLNIGYRGDVAIGIRASGFSTFSSSLFSDSRQYRTIGGERSTVTMDEMNRIIPSRIDFSLFWRIQF